ncbi:hypothetical protein [Legionella yabuuchiae]|uniref:hypothetical protein n=1 Tax=Legionella yabuuchiae TaxID=376727 RepID=UPI0010565C06|nr:hypothetical protein [Legionella yabuuchiae]
MDTLNLNWLVSDLNRQKAQKRFDIKQLECQLRLLLTSEAPSREVAMLCDHLSKHYAEFLLLSEGSSRDMNVQNPLLPMTWQDLLADIQKLSARFFGPIKSSTEQLLASQLQQKYQHCSDLILKKDSHSSTAVHNRSNIPLMPVIAAKKRDEWLQALVHFANEQAGVNRPELLGQLNTVNDSQLRALSEVFAKQEFIDLINAILFYKLHPEDLFPQGIHPEKLVSVKTRLTLLYDFIESFYHTISQVLIHKGFPSHQDYLVHDDLLPHGIEIKADEHCRELILNAVKSWKINATRIDPKVSLNQLHEIFRAYKFWFNPNRLIDAIMNLEFKLAKQYSEQPPIDSLYQYIVHLYQSMSTTECLDLYGYFSNKDSNYFIWTLILVKQGGQFEWLPELKPSQYAAVLRVYEAISCVMNALREVLEERHIKTQSFKHDALPSKPLTPGRRNREALLRIITLYGSEEIKPNRQIEQLFKQLESIS